MKTTKSLTLTMLLSALVALTFGCASKPSYKRGFDFSQYRSFALLPLPEKGSYQDPAIITRLGSSAEKGAVETLTAKGFTQTSEDKADFLVKMLFDWQPDHGRSEQRFFNLQILDGKSKEVVWSQYAYRVTDTTISPETARQTVARLLKSFPPTAR